MNPITAQALIDNVKRANAKGNAHLASPSDALKGIEKLLLGGPVKKRIRQSGKPVLNKLETEFYEQLKKAGWLDIYPQAFKVKLGNGIGFTVDFVCSEASGQLSAFEVKGRHAFDGALDRLKVAASLYECIHWYLVWKDASGAWQQQRVLS